MVKLKVAVAAGPLAATARNTRGPEGPGAAGGPDTSPRVAVSVLEYATPTVVSPRLSAGITIGGFTFGGHADSRTRDSTPPSDQRPSDIGDPFPAGRAERGRATLPDSARTECRVYGTR